MSEVLVRDAIANIDEHLRGTQARWASSRHFSPGIRFRIDAAGRKPQPDESALRKFDPPDWVDSINRFRLRAIEIEPEAYPFSMSYDAAQRPPRRAEGVQ